MRETKVFTSIKLLQRQTLLSLKHRGSCMGRHGWDIGYNGVMAPWVGGPRSCIDYHDSQGIPYLRRSVAVVGTGMNTGVHTDLGVCVVVVLILVWFAVLRILVGFICVLGGAVLACNVSHFLHSLRKNESEKLRCGAAFLTQSTWRWQVDSN